MRRPKTLTALLPGDEPPSEFKVWGFGAVETLKGTYIFDQEAADLVMAAYQDYGNELSFDYNHQAIFEVGDTPAAGWFNLELRDDGLWAVNCRWTPNAANRIRNKEYRYFSPAFHDDVNGRITELVNIALTNIPATKDLEPLVAASRRMAINDRRVTALALSFQEICQTVAEAIERRWGYSAWLQDVYDDRVIFKFDGRHWQVGYHMDGAVAVIDGDAVEVQHDYTPVTANRGEQESMKSILKALGLPETATEAEALVALQAIQSGNQQVVTLTGKSSMAEALGVLQAHKAAAEQVTTLTAKVAELEGQIADGEVTKLIEQGKADGKIPPALVETLTAMGKQNIATLKSYLEHAPKVAPTGSHTPPGADGGPVTLSVEELAVCKQMGITPEQYKAHAAKQST